MNGPLKMGNISDISQSIDYIGMAITPFHARGINAVTLKHNFDRGLFIIKPHISDGYLLDKDDIYGALFGDVQVYFWDELLNDDALSWINLNLSAILTAFRQKRFPEEYDKFIISPLEPDIQLLPIARQIWKNSVPGFVTVDEGFGTYLRRRKLRKINRYERFDNFGLQSVFRQLMIETMGRPFNLIKNRQLRAYNVDQFNIFEKDNSHLSVNKNIAMWYKKSFQQQTHFDKKYDCIIVTQPLSEQGHLENEDELMIIEAIVNHLSADKVGIKPHPRERDGKYTTLSNKFDSVEILSKSKPVEDIYLSSAPDRVIGFTSTSLLTATAIFDLPAYTVAPMLKEFVPKEVFEGYIQIFLTLTEGLLDELQPSLENSIQ